MPVTMGGMASGMDTDAIIKKLVDIEARPIRQMERDIRKSNQRKAALRQLESKIKSLNDKAKNLYGFRANYHAKKAISSNKNILEASANRQADNGFRKIEVVQVASTHKIASDNIDLKKKLPGGRFTITVNGETRKIRFKGGSIRALRERIEEDAKEVVSTSIVRTGGQNHVLTMQSKVPGTKGEILLKGSRKLLKSIGLVNGMKDGSRAKQNIVFDQRYFTSYTGKESPGKDSGTLSVKKDGSSVTLKGLLWREYSLPTSKKIKKSSKLEFKFKYNKIKEEEAASRLPFKVELGPKEKILVKGIELKGYNISRIRPIDKKPKKKGFDAKLGIGIVSTVNGKRKEKIYSISEDSKGKQEIPVGKDFANKKITKIIFYCNEGTTEFKNAKIITPLDAKGVYNAKNSIHKPQDAKIKIDGVEIVRDKNNDLSDVIKGVNLNLKGPSKIAITLKVEPDIDKAIGSIQEFVKAYNEYLSLHKELIKTDRVSKPGSFKKSKRKNGPFVGDMMLIRLDNMLKRTINAAYRSRADKPIKLISQMGVSTGAINADWESIKEGKLVIDEPLLRTTIRENPDGVQVFFASDTDGDNRTDSGMAFSLVRKIKPYVSFGRNIIKSKINLEDESIKMASDRIERKELHLKKYEEKLRMKFAAMEKAMSGAKAQKNWMNNQMGGGKKDK